ncbi:TonB-dependent receptor (plasmid) [Sphingobium sp. SJ10-10]|uniref:TonB-dependent receptor n=1 Tax=Sphingobium sp. SJ10-10 TaxID=3114999 RepID=UPI002E181BFC|nr:TonB-dependent receptor [Sphingobium sp. SJ10-10]
MYRFDAYLGRFTKLALLTGTCLATAVPLPVVAQDNSTAANSRGGLEDIIVTARKRAESVQDVPVAVTAMSAEMIRSADLTSIEKVAARTPNLTVGRASNGSGAQLTMRGIGSSSTSIGIEQSVATVVDGAYYGQGRVINEGFFDLERIEVLKGPQALFFGKNATAGVISITTADPGDKAEFFTRAGYEFRSQQVQLEGVASTPLGDTLGIRLAVRGSKMFGGYIRNQSTAMTVNTLDPTTGIVTPHASIPSDTDQPQERELLGRLTLKWTPTDALTNTLKVMGDYNRVNNGSWNYVVYRCATGFSTLNPANACQDRYITHQNKMPTTIAANFPYAKDSGELYNTYKSWGANNTLNYALDNVTLTSVTNYQWNSNQWTIPGELQANVGSIWATERSTWRAFSEELRALTSFDGPVNLMIGGLYQSTKRFLNQVSDLGLENAAASPAFRYVSIDKISTTKGETLAAFGQVTWKVVPTIELAGGVRYTHEKKDSFFVQPDVSPALTGIFVPSTAPGGTLTANQVFKDWSPEATITWKPTNDILIYGAYKTAYKSGGFSNGSFNSALSSNNLADITFGKEKARGFEAGFKSELFDRQLRFNLTAYSYKYSGLQVDFFNSPIFAFNTLSADARTKGVEMEFELAPAALPGLNIHGAWNYNRARYTDFPNAPCYSGQTPNQGCNLTLDAVTGNYRPIAGAEVGTRQDLAGASLSMAPKWTGTLGASYDTDLGGDLSFGISADARYSSSYLPSGFGQALSRIDSYVTLDGALRLRSTQGWEVALMGKNLTNQFYVTGVVDGPSTGSGTGTPGGIAGDQIGFAGMPRTVQLQVSWRF